MSDKRKIILDTDPGIDDAVAIALAAFSEAIDIKLITTVSGNVHIDHVTENVLKLLTFYGKNIPVAKGANTPLIRQSRDGSRIHGETGMAGYAFQPGDKSLLIDSPAVVAMYQLIKQYPGEITLVTIGPLTNIALLLKLYPDVASDIKEIILMGGTPDRGNYGVYTEFNIGYDPEAAQVVFNSTISRTMVGMNIGIKAIIQPEVSENIRHLNKIGDMFYALFKTYRGTFQSGLTMYDATAIAYLVRPDMFQTVDTFVTVETQGQYTTGATIVDLNNYLHQPSNTTVCLDIDAEVFEEWFVESIEAFDID
ncbi:ribonucleoside hydrolase RihC [Dolosigranulum pigrum]|uniref:ribonucleoside hydrolase RihC n=1 Tax=Dolosigranulum pigrum TaxID=29394 RepID=UPI001AD86923|nr:ribonucleoside hydrolase RihC [Dolosigranulum pigrum]QTJ45493.1 ribonucleoside hydrolase RihC [Dolosigranulum pigrum]